MPGETSNQSSCTATAVHPRLPAIVRTNAAKREKVRERDLLAVTIHFPSGLILTAERPRVCPISVALSRYCGAACCSPFVNAGGGMEEVPFTGSAASAWFGSETWSSFVMSVESRRRLGYGSSPFREVVDIGWTSRSMRSNHIAFGLGSIFITFISCLRCNVWCVRFNADRSAEEDPRSDWCCGWSPASRRTAFYACRASSIL